MKKTTVLCILDGVGENPNALGNAVMQANTPHLDKFYKTYPHSQLLTHGAAVGLPEGQMGNSEVGHTNLGAGRIVPQMLERIRTDLNTAGFTEKKQAEALFNLAKNGKPLHLIGLVSVGGVHSHSDHLLGLIKLLAPLGTPLYIHAITDGRDTAPDAAKAEIAALTAAISEFPNVSLVDICGRFYAMDRDGREERTQAAYSLYTQAKAEFSVASAQEAVKAAYARNESDEFIKPTLIDKGMPVQKEDTLVFFNFRADRMRQLTSAFISDGYPHIFTMTNYNQAFDAHVTVLYPPEAIKNTLGEVVAGAGKTQFRIAETEKYAHVTFFFNGGRENAFPQEARKIIPSPKVHTYDLQPEMSVQTLAKDLFSALQNGDYDMIICNIANGDMVGHTGNLAAAIKAMEAVDVFLGGLEAAIKTNSGHLLLTADHGNCEHMIDEAGDVITSHTTFPVPLFYIGAYKNIALNNGILADIAPTMLHLMGLDTPTEMTGQNLIKKAE